MPRTFQARLTISFVGVVALTLALVTVFVVNRLDDYFTKQQQTELQPGPSVQRDPSQPLISVHAWTHSE